MNSYTPGGMGNPQELEVAAGMGGCPLAAGLAAALAAGLAAGRPARRVKGFLSCAVRAAISAVSASRRAWAALSEREERELAAWDAATRLLYEEAAGAAAEAAGLKAAEAGAAALAEAAPEAAAAEAGAGAAAEAAADPVYLATVAEACIAPSFAFAYIVLGS